MNTVEKLAISQIVSPKFFNFSLSSISILPNQNYPALV